MNTRTKSNKLKTENLNKKKSKHGKKNWRKNIDVTDIEKKDVIINQEKLLEKKVSNLKDEDMFVIDSAPINKLQNKFLNRKTQKKEKKVKKLSLVEENLIKRIQKNLLEKKQEAVVEKPQLKNLWDDDVSTTARISFPTQKLKFPSVPLPHPGQSYNPSKEDLSNLLSKLVEHNRKKISTDIDQLKTEEILEEALFPSDSETDEDDVKLENTNNPPVDDFEQRKSKKEKKRNIQKKLNLHKESQIISRKHNKIILANEKSLKRIEKERSINLKEEQEKKGSLLLKEKTKEDLRNMGIVDDPDMLTDFYVKKEQVPLRNMKTRNNIISERFENIIKRNVVGQFNHDNTKKKRNKKLNKMKVRDGFCNDFGFVVDEDKKLKIFE